MKNKSIIFFDIDGTLLNHNQEIPLSTKQAIFKLKELGHEVAIATGRPPTMFEDIRNELNINTFVSCNGQYVVLNNEVIYKQALNTSAIEKLNDLTLKNNHSISFVTPEGTITNAEYDENRDKSFESLKLINVPKYSPNYFRENDLYQGFIYCLEGEEKQYEEEIIEFNFVRWSPFTLDIITKGESKAKGIQKLMDKLGYLPEQQYAFGDGLNDIEMLSTVQNSVAMGNASDKVKQVAKYITKSVDEDGILYGLKMVGLI